jgi:hypothetical protein
VDPASGVERNLFAAEGVTYTVVAEDGVARRTYTAKATKLTGELSSECDIIEFNINGGDPWDILGNVITKTYLSTDGEAYNQYLYPVITFSPGASVSPSPDDPQNFYADLGVTYTVTAADGVTTKTYTVKAWVEQVGPSGVLADRTGWTADARYGTHPWAEHGGSPETIFDGDVNTGWHTELAAEAPHCITIDMQSSRRVTAIELQHMPEALGNDWIYINQVRVYLRNDEPYNPHVDDLDWHYPYWEAVVEYTWDGAGAPITINLPQVTEGQYLMLLFPDTRTAPHMSFTELNVYVEE